MADPRCGRCGAPWQPEITGACRYCGAVAPPDDHAPAVAGGLDPNVLHTVLRSWAADPRPLAGLALGLAAALGPRVTVAEDGDVIARLSVMLDDWTYEAHPGPLGPEGLAIHTVRSVVLKREPLAFAEWLAVVAAHVAEFAGAHPEVRQFFLQHVQQGGRR